MTLVEYMYRDASNYKLFAAEILPGDLSREEIIEIFDLTKDSLCPDSHFFYPGQIGLDAPTFVSKGYEAYDDDPEWHELLVISHSEKEPTTTISAEAFLEAFRNGSAIRPCDDL
jgi:hypothetical protein